MQKKSVKRKKFCPAARTEKSEGTRNAAEKNTFLRLTFPFSGGKIYVKNFGDEESEVCQL